MPRPADPAIAPSLVGTGYYGKAYVAFEDTAGAQAAKSAIHGRVFAGNMVQVGGHPHRRVERPGRRLRARRYQQAPARLHLLTARALRPNALAGRVHHRRGLRRCAGEPQLRPDLPRLPACTTPTRILTATGAKGNAVSGYALLQILHHWPQWRMAGLARFLSAERPQGRRRLLMGLKPVDGRGQHHSCMAWKLRDGRGRWTRVERVGQAHERLHAGRGCDAKGASLSLEGPSACARVALCGRAVMVRQRAHAMVQAMCGRVECVF